MPDDTLDVVLSKDEKKLYRVVLTEYDEDPNEYLSSRRLECPPEHYADLADMFADMGGKELSRLRDDGDEEFSFEMVGAVDGLMAKLGTKLQEQGLAERAREEIQDRGIDHNPYADE